MQGPVLAYILPSRPARGPVVPRKASSGLGEAHSLTSGQGCRPAHLAAEQPIPGSDAAIRMAVGGALTMLTSLTLANVSVVSEVRGSPLREEGN
jgi:hypothetical protein